MASEWLEIEDGEDSSDGVSRGSCGGDVGKGMHT